MTMWNRPLTPEEVREEYERSRAGLHPLAHGLVAWFSLDGSNDFIDLAEDADEPFIVGS